MKPSPALKTWGIDTLDRFQYLSGQSIRCFADNLAGSLGNRITSVAGHFGGLTNAVAWRILPIFVDFIGALIVFWTVDGKMMVALGFAVILIMAGLIMFGERGRPLVIPPPRAVCPFR